MMEELPLDWINDDLKKRQSQPEDNLEDVLEKCCPVSEAAGVGDFLSFQSIPRKPI